ncbi:MAG: MarR family transcriptional regulator [bacterium]
METINGLSLTEAAKEMADLTCELARICSQKEQHFASMFNITPAEFRCLRLFTFKKQISIKEILQELVLTPGRITHILTSLEEKNFVTRSMDPTDKRNIIVELTPRSEPFIKNIYESHINIHQEILEKIDVDKRDFILTSIQDLITALKSWNESKHSLMK